MRGHGLSVPMGFVAPLHDGLCCPEPCARGVGDGCGSGLLPWLSPGTAGMGTPCAITHAGTLRAGRQGAQADPCPPFASLLGPAPLPAPLPLMFISSWCLSLPPGAPSLSSRQAMGCVGVLGTPEDPEEWRGAQGEGPSPSPPECQELTAVPVPQAVRARGAWDYGCPCCHPHGCPHDCPQGGGLSPGVAVPPLFSHPFHPWGACVWLLWRGGSWCRVG